MGRGRAKAKQTKVARDLKYNSDRTDLDRLRAELGATTTAQRPEPDDEDRDERYAAYLDDEDDEDEA